MQYLSHCKCLRVRLIINFFLFYMIFLCSRVVYSLKYGCLRRNINGKEYNGRTKGRSKRSNEVRIEIGGVKKQYDKIVPEFRRLSVLHGSALGTHPLRFCCKQIYCVIRSFEFRVLGACAMTDIMRHNFISNDWSAANSSNYFLLIYECNFKKYRCRMLVSLAAWKV
jgi:hypothetical protein